MGERGVGVGADGSGEAVGGGTVEVSTPAVGEMVVGRISTGCAVKAWFVAFAGVLVSKTGAAMHPASTICKSSQGIICCWKRVLLFMSLSFFSDQPSVACSLLSSKV